MTKEMILRNLVANNEGVKFHDDFISFKIENKELFSMSEEEDNWTVVNIDNLKENEFDQFIDLMGECNFNMGEIAEKEIVGKTRCSMKLNLTSNTIVEQSSMNGK